MQPFIQQLSVPVMDQVSAQQGPLGSVAAPLQGPWGPPRWCQICQSFLLLPCNLSGNTQDLVPMVTCPHPQGHMKWLTQLPCPWGFCLATGRPPADHHKG